MQSLRTWPESVRNRILRRRLGVAARRPIRTAHELEQWFHQRSPCRLLSGPFQGLVYGARSFGSMHLPKLLGTYERELSGFFASANLARYARFLNIGCAEGYYANGIAYVLKLETGTLPSEVTGVDVNEEALAEARRIAQWNGLQARFVRELDSALSPPGPGKTLIVCDVDGAEKELMVPSRFPALDRTDFILELHDAAGRRAILDDIRSRFAPTHECVVVEFQPRQLSDFPSKELGLELDEKLKIEAMDERRVTSFCWLSLKAKSQCRI